jgi:putative PIN family toxin of toxin-antitoxin system
VIRRLRAGDYTLVYSLAAIDELTGKLVLPRIRIKYDLSEDVIEDILATIAVRGQLVIPSRRINVCRDPDDNMFIEAALAGDASVVVTGDDDLLALRKFESVQFVTPKIFLGMLDKRSTK